MLSMNRKSPAKKSEPAKKASRGRAFNFLLDPVTEANLDVIISDKPHLDKTAAIREAAHEVASRIRKAKENN